MKLHMDLVSIEDDYHPTKEEEYDYWAAPGEITFYVIQNIPGVFEIELLEWSGCAGGLEESCGIDFYLQQYWSLHHEVKEGVTYTLTNVTVVFTRGDGWTTDDDAEYYYDDLVSHFNPITWIKQKISNIWWRQVICRIQGRN